jgi:uncharacterized membrane protein
MSKARLETFSDGVFSIAITLLVLTIAQPSNYERLGHELAQRWPAFAAYAVSFVVIGIMWLNHHSIFNYLAHVDRAMIALNMLLLMTVVFIPYPTGVFGEALRRGDGEEVAAVFYSVAMFANALAWAALWLYASIGRRLLSDEFPESERAASTMAFVIGPVPYGIAILIAFVNAYACLAFHGLLGIYYALDPLSRRAAHVRPDDG